MTVDNTINTKYTFISSLTPNTYSRLHYHGGDCWPDSCVLFYSDAPAFAIFLIFLHSSEQLNADLHHAPQEQPPCAQYSQCELSCCTKGLVRSSHMSAPEGRWRTSETRWVMTQRMLADQGDLGNTSGVKSQSRSQRREREEKKKQAHPNIRHRVWRGDSENSRHYKVWVQLCLTCRSSQLLWSKGTHSNSNDIWHLEGKTRDSNFALSLHISSNQRPPCHRQQWKTVLYWHLLANGGRSCSQISHPQLSPLRLT